MESLIKVKATQREMDFFSKHFSVKSWNRERYLNDKKGRYLWEVYLRHGEEHTKLQGRTFTVDFLMKKLKDEACHIKIEATIKSALDEVFADLSFFNEEEKFKGVLNNVLKDYSLRIA